jgi:multidrug efflux pump subunit AcrB
VGAPDAHTLAFNGSYFNTNRMVKQYTRNAYYPVKLIERAKVAHRVAIAQRHRLIKIFFQPHVNVANAVAQVTAISQVQACAACPLAPRRPSSSSTTPPAFPSCSWASPAGPQRAAAQRSRTNTIRTQLATVEGAQTPFPYGGKQRQIQVDLDPHALQAKGLSPADVVNAINAQNLIAPSGTMKIGPLRVCGRDQLRALSGR